MGSIVFVPVPRPRVSEQAARLEEERLNKLKELQDAYKHLAMDPALKKVIRRLLCHYGI